MQHLSLTPQSLRNMQHWPLGVRYRAYPRVNAAFTRHPPSPDFALFHVVAYAVAQLVVQRDVRMRQYEKELGLVVVNALGALFKEALEVRVVKRSSKAASKRSASDGCELAR